MQAKLVITGQDGKSQEVPFDRPRITIGRKAGNDLHFNRPEISSNHAAFLLENDTFFVSDLGSTNGTIMNGARLLANQKYSLQNGDVITITPYRIAFITEKDLTDTVEEDEVEEAKQQERAGSGTILDIGGKLSTGTEPHKKTDVAKAQEAAEPAEAAEAPPAKPSEAPPRAKPKEEPKPVSAAPPPPPQPREPISPDPEDAVAAAIPEIAALPKSGKSDYLWLGLGALFLLIALGLIAYLLLGI